MVNGLNPQQAIIDETPELPNLEQAASKFKSELRKLSKNDLVRQAASYYMRLTIASFEIAALQEKLTALQTQESEK